MVKKFLVSVLTLLFMLSSAFTFASCESINNIDDLKGLVDDTNILNGDETPTETSIYLGAGYNVITSAYYNQTDAKITSPILNMEKLSSYVRVDANSSNSNKSVTIIGESIKDYTQKISASASISGEISFIKSFETNFSISYDTTTTTNQMFVTFQNILSRKRDYFYDCTTQNLADNVADSFTSAVETMTAEALINKYGTHVLTDILLGGRYELNYLYEKSSEISETEIKASVSASNRVLSGSTSASDTNNAKKIMENSSLNFLSYGGAGSDTTSFESAKNTYQNWLTSLDNTAKISLVDCTQSVPLWEIIALMDIADSQEKADAVEARYNSIIATYSSQMQAPISINTKPLVKDFYIEYGDNATEAKSKLQGKGVPLSNILNIDLNKGAGGDYVYFGWTTTTNPSEAIRGIYGGVFDPGNGGKGSILINGLYYTRWSLTDLNRDAGGADIFLYASKDVRAGAPITDFAYVCDESPSKNIDGYSAVLAYYEGSYRALDVNYDSGGADIFLYFTRK